MVRLGLKSLDGICTAWSRRFSSSARWRAPRRRRPRRPTSTPISSSCGAPSGGRRRLCRRAGRARARGRRRLRARPRCVAELAAFHLRRSQPDEAEKAAKAALAIDENNIEAHRVLGLVYAGYADAASGAPRTRQQIATVPEGRHHASRTRGGAARRPAISCCTSRWAACTCAPTSRESRGRAEPRVTQNPGSVQARLALAQAHAANKNLPARDRDARDHRRRGAARGGRARAVPGTGRPASRSRRHLHEGARSAADQPRAQVAAHRRALRRPGLHGAAAFAGDAQRQHPEDARFPRLRARALFDAGDRSGGAVACWKPPREAFPKDANTLFSSPICTRTRAAPPTPSRRCARCWRPSRPMRTR